MARGSDLPVRTKRLLNKVGGWRRTKTKKKAQKGKTDSRGKMCAKILRQPLIHTQRKKRKKRKKEAVRLRRRCIRHEIQFSRRSQGRT